MNCENGSHQTITALYGDMSTTSGTGDESPHQRHGRAIDRDCPLAPMQQITAFFRSFRNSPVYFAALVRALTFGTRLASGAVRTGVETDR
jgi:hypothetical protein